MSASMRVMSWFVSSGWRVVLEEAKQSCSSGTDEALGWDVYFRKRKILVS